MHSAGVGIEWGFIELVQNALHQLVDASCRLAMLRELRRVSSDSVIISAWVDGK